MKINIAILEDNNSHFQQLSNSIFKWASEYGHIVTIRHFINEADILQSNFMSNCNLLFSDIELQNSSKNGIDICTQLRDSHYQGDIIFLTAFREYVFQGYQVQAINYLLKPITDGTIYNCMNKYISMHNCDFYYLHKNNNIIQIPYNTIISINKIGHDCCINTTTGLYTERTSLQYMEQHLPEQFFRCHKSCIININYITSLSGSTLRLVNKQTQTVSRVYLDDLKKILIKLASTF